MFDGTAHSVFNGYSGVNTVMIIEINVADTKALEATLATGPFSILTIPNFVAI